MNIRLTFATAVAVLTVHSAAAMVKIPTPTEMLQQIQGKQDEITAIQDEITAAGKEAALAPTAKARAAAWRKVEAGERKFYRLLDGDFAGVKLDAAAKKGAKEKYYRKAVDSLKQAEEQVTDPAAKKFLAERRKSYLRKLPKPAKEKPAADAPAKP